MSWYPRHPRGQQAWFVTRNVKEMSREKDLEWVIHFQSCFIFSIYCLKAVGSGCGPSRVDPCGCSKFLRGIQLRGQEEGEGQPKVHACPPGMGWGFLECPGEPKPSYFWKYFILLCTVMGGKKEKNTLNWIKLNLIGSLKCILCWLKWDIFLYFRGGGGGFCPPFVHVD